MEENKNIEQNNNNNYYRPSGMSLGLICGLFSVLGLIGGFLYPVDSDQRDEFISGWKTGFFFSLITTIILVILTIKG